MTQQMDDLEIGIGRLKKSSREQQIIIDELKKERSFLIKKNDSIDGSIKNLQSQINKKTNDGKRAKGMWTDSPEFITN